MNYGDTNEKGEYNIFSGACNDDGNVIGTMIHGILDENSIIKVNIETLCYNEEKISIENTIPKSPTNFCYKEDNKIVMCEFVTGVKALRNYYLKYDGIIIQN